MRDPDDLSTALLHRGSLWLIFEPRDMWVGLYVAPRAVYVCLLPCLVIKRDRERAKRRAAGQRLHADAAYVRDAGVAAGYDDEFYTRLIKGAGRAGFDFGDFSRRLDGFIASTLQQIDTDKPEKP